MAPRRTVTRHASRRHWLLACVPLLLSLALAACTGASLSTPPTPQPTEPFTIYGWAGYMPQSVLDEFAAAEGVPVDYQAFDSYDQASEGARAGGYDLVVMGTSHLPQLIEAGALAPIDYRNVPNFRFVSPNFRDLAYDPGNTYSVLFQWGSTGLLVRSDLVGRPITGWNDLWDPALRGKVAVWPIQRTLIGIALKSLGYSVNSEDPAELEQALQRLITLKANAALFDNTMASSAEFLISGEYALTYGWPLDIRFASEQGVAVEYVLPKEGLILWGDNLVIPARSQQRERAERFINFILSPEVSARITNELLVATPNEAARPLIAPDVLNDPLIFPPNELLQNAEIELPLSPEGERRHDAIWQRFLDS